MLCGSNCRGVNPGAFEMATYNLSAVQNGSTLAFDPATDQLVFDLPGVSAANLLMSSLNTGSIVLFQLPTLSFSLVGTHLSDLGSADLKFADGSRFVQANSGNSWATSLSTGSGNDQLVGSRAAGPNLTASSSADGVVSFSGSSSASALSGDGRYAVFQSSANNLLPGPGPFGGANYVKDLATGELLFVGNAEIVLGIPPDAPILSADGAKVAFVSRSISLTAADGNGSKDIYLRDLSTGTITLVSASASGVVGNGASAGVALSNDGRFAVFQSAASNLVANDTSVIDVFQKDMLTGAIKLVTVPAGSSIGLGGNGASISGNGSLVAFSSIATSLVSGDTNATSDVFVRGSGSSFERVSVSSAGAQGNASSNDAAISADGRFVAFSSAASNLVSGDTNVFNDVFLRDLVSDTTTLVSSSAQGVVGNGSSGAASISGDGRYVAFTSAASNLVAGDTDVQRDVFVKDMLTGAIARVGAQGFEPSNAPAISADGSRISFDTLVNGGFSGSAQQVLVFANPLLSRTLAGGSGNDVYVIDNAADAVVEAASAGTDTVRSSISLALADNVEQLVLLGSGNLNGTGNALANVITGTLGNNRLDGGDGTDTASYVSASDGVTVDLNLTDPQDTGSSGVDTLVSIESLTGGSFDDALFGNDGANVLNGGLGADLLIGGAGNDTFWIDQAGDLMLEEAGGGTDTVCSTITWTLGSDVENLYLKGSANVNATGNAGNNVLAGNSGANVLTGGDGTDTASYGSAKAGVNVALDRSGYQNLGSSGADLLVGIENLTGSAFNDTLSGNAGDNVFNGGNGLDTVSYARAGSAVFFSLALTGPQDTRGAQDPVARSGGAVGLDSGTGGEGVDTVLNVENLLGGAGNDSLSGNGSANRLDGGLGTDTLTGGAGNDTFVVDSRFDRLVEVLDEGLDSVISTVSLTLVANLENLTLAEGFVTDAIGNELANRLTGNSADNELDGRGGVDTLVGGAGNDFYFVDESNDRVIESAGGGVDRVVANVNFALGAEVEDLDLNFPATVGTGNALNNRITGDSNSQTLQGLDGDDRLDAQGGADTLIGGNGNDTYIIVNTGVVVQEAAGGGTIDTVDSSVSHTLAAEVERLVLSGDSAINGTGNAAANSITGNSAANTLDGAAGADTLAGGGGNDFYRVDTGDVVTESSGGGDDTMSAGFSFTVAANVEAGVLTGTGNLSLTGNSLANRLTGNDGSNILSSGGGADTLSGGAGNDTYNIDNAAAQVFEQAGSGTDTVQSTVSVTLAADVERLTLAGTNPINGTGNDLDNLIQGNAAANAINGGDGIDTVTYANLSAAVTANLGTGVASGGGGADTFIAIENLTGGSGNDRLTGNTLNNALNGGAGNDSLDGGAGNDTLVGGGGNDTLAGGAGDDTFFVGSAVPVVSEAAGGGIDTVVSDISAGLSALNVENLTLAGSAVNGDGNALDNRLLGNGLGNLLQGGNGNDILDGAGGNDTLVGGAGSDVFFVDSSADQAIDVSGASGGFDTVNASASTTLDAFIENLVLTGTLAIDGTGNDERNTLTGNSAVNRLDGAGGADTLLGGAGNDTFRLGTLDGSADLVSDFVSGADKILIGLNGIKVGDGDQVVEGAVSTAGTGGFLKTAELVDVGTQVAGAILTSSAAVAIGSATSAYAIGNTAIFAVDNGVQTAIFRFAAADADAAVESSELTLLATLTSTANVVIADFVFGA
jgi:trimeric autotransporter adhesin